MRKKAIDILKDLLDELGSSPEKIASEYGLQMRNQWVEARKYVTEQEGEVPYGMSYRHRDMLAEQGLCDCGAQDLGPHRPHTEHCCIYWSNADWGEKSTDEQARIREREMKTFIPDLAGDVRTESALDEQIRQHDIDITERQRQEDNYDDAEF